MSPRRTRRAGALAVPAPSDRRFRRARVGARSLRSRRRARLRAVRVVTILALLAGAGYASVVAVVRSKAMRLQHIEVLGNERLAAGDVLALLDGFEGRHLLALDLDALRARLRSSPWVADVEVKRVLPGTLEVHVRERTPMGIARFGRQLFLVDPAGVVVDAYGPRHADLELPLIDGLAGPDGDVGRTDPGRAALVARLVDSLSDEASLRERVSQIDVTDIHDVVVVLDADQAALHLGERRFVERLHSYLELRPTLLARVTAIDYVDLRFEDRIYVRPFAADRVPARNRAVPSPEEVEEATRMEQ